MKKFMAIAAVVVVSFSAQSSFCGQSGCKVTFVDVDVDGTEKPIMLLEAAGTPTKSSMGRVFDDVNTTGKKIQTEMNSSVSASGHSDKSSPVQINRVLSPMTIYSA
ncbi:hypothetical protein AN237_25120 (plasmid) [Raoultella ornithinolytica]|uniref:hypothetical protein n=1 Tax=Raoultella ornithinolytica TaxID=54291 RepID=UPI00084A184E|nr:hypothetical protein [Raoultella ornithinolytica]AOO59841.1 hypothetical protein AN237_25120 [Raoultella ornithinolytica]